MVTLLLNAADSQKFSLLESGVLDNPSCKLLLINGMEDSIFPIEDNFLVGIQRDKKDLLARGNRGHMGNPGAEEILYDWIDKAVAGKPYVELQAEGVSNSGSIPGGLCPPPGSFKP